jgi:pimeloyl-ACP methyl ester carboxylesterase
MLISRELVATSVIRTIRLGRFKTRQIYGPLLDFCTSRPGLQLSNGQSFFAFPYDWRGDLAHSAVDLAALVNRAPAPVYVVAHSMGGLVTRIMLNRSGPAARRVRGVFQIAPPDGGSSKAFITLKRRPSLGPISDSLWYLYYFFSPEKRARLMNALGNMHSIYQLLPPLEEKVLLQSGGIQRSALDADAWAFRDQCMLEAAVRAQKQLAAVPTVPTRCVYSAQYPTEWLLAIDDNWNPVASGRKAGGDGTITSASASARSSDTVAFGGAGAEHTQLCSRADVHEALREFLT